MSRSSDISIVDDDTSTLTVDNQPESIDVSSLFDFDGADDLFNDDSNPSIDLPDSPILGNFSNPSFLFDDKHNRQQPTQYMEHLWLGLDRDSALDGPC